MCFGAHTEHSPYLADVKIAWVHLTPLHTACLAQQHLAAGQTEFDFASAIFVFAHWFKPAGLLTTYRHMPEQEGPGKRG